MEKLLEKISSYQLLNFLFTGAVCWFILSYLGLQVLHGTSICQTIVGCYFLGMTMSRIGSLVVEEIFKKIGWIQKIDYVKQVKADKRDVKVELMLSLCNTYRTLAAVFFTILLLLILSCIFPSNIGLRHNAAHFIFIITLTAIYMFAFVKQHNYLKDRIDVAEAAE